MRKKKCYRCELTKPIESFVKEKRNKHGVSGLCKTCRNSARFMSPIPHKAFWRLKEKQKKYPIAIETDKHEVAQIFEIFDGRCAYCHAEESEETGTLTLEHIIPLIDGGRHHVSNLIIVCRRCNSFKGTKTLVSFYRTHEPFHGVMLDFLFMYIARFSGRDTEEVAKEFLKYEEDAKAKKSIRGA